MLRRLISLSALISGVLVVSSATTAAHADQMVIFRDSRQMTVEAAEWVSDKGMVRLDFGGGNEAFIGQGTVLEIRDVIPRQPDPSELRGFKWEKHAGEHVDYFAEAAEKFNLAPELIVAVALVESRIDPFAMSHKGALGVMQIMPATAKDLGLENPFDASENIAAGARYLRQMMDEFNGDLDLALAAYNAGPGNVRRYDGIPPFKETQDYVRKVRAKVNELEVDPDRDA